MNFLAPAAWGWLGLAAPVIALYLIRLQLERRRVSTLLFWEQVPTQTCNSSLWRKIRRWLSLLLQILFIALITLALARPLPPWQTAQPVSKVFVLDPSPSMLAKEGEVSRWEKAVGMVAAQIRQMRPFDEAAILVGSDPPVVLSGWTAQRRALLEALELARPPGGPPSLRAALALAGNLAAIHGRAEIVLFTDGVWAEPDEVPPDVRCEWVGKIQPNAAITHFSARRSYSSPKDVRLAAAVLGQPGGEASANLELLNDGRLVDVQRIALDERGRWERDWDVRLEGSARLEARLVGFPPDALVEDDTARVEIEAVPPVKVLLISPPNDFLKAGLEALPLVEWAQVENVAGFPDPQALYIFNGIAPPPAFAEANVLLINPPSEGFWGRRSGQIDRPLVSEVDAEEPLMRHTGFANVRLESAAKWEKPVSASVFADSFGDPLIFGQWDERKKWAVFAFPLDGSDFTLRTAFPILLGNAVESLRPEKTVSPSTAPGLMESSLQPAATPASPASESGRFAGFGWPMWWLALVAACAWLLGEWWSYTRRITE